jgi:ABC-2 type transport system permease protein
MGKYLEMIKISIKNTLVYKIDIIINIIGNIFKLYIQMYLWTALYSTNKVEGISLTDMFTYQAIGIFLGVFYDSSVAWEVGNMVKDGSISIEFLRPYRLPFMLFSKSIGVTVTTLPGLSGF